MQNKHRNRLERGGFVLESFISKNVTSTKERSPAFRSACNFSDVSCLDMTVFGVFAGRLQKKGSYFLHFRTYSLHLRSQIGKLETAWYCPNGPLSVLPVQSRQPGIILKAQSNAKGKNQFKCQKKV